MLKKLNYLKKVNRYRRLLQNILSANDKSNFLASVFESTIAFQFESTGLSLEYEVKQDTTDNSSIDFARQMDSGKSIYIEARLLQQDYATNQSIENQLDSNNFYKILKNGNDDHDSIVRLQNVIISKIQRKDGTPFKFLRVDENTVNLVAIEASQLMLGMIDLNDCFLSTHGDPYVKEVYRRGIFGLFQKPSSKYPEDIQIISSSFNHIRSTLEWCAFSF